MCVCVCVCVCVSPYSSCDRMMWQSGLGGGSIGMPCGPSSPWGRSPRSSEFYKHTQRQKRVKIECGAGELKSQNKTTGREE